MATTTLATVTDALASLFADEITNNINRSVVLAQILGARPGFGKNIQWVNRFGTATPAGAVIADGADVSVYNSDAKVPAVLQYATYHDAFSITGKAAAAAMAAGSPAELANLFAEEMSESVTRLARAIAAGVYTGTGATDNIHGLFATVPAIGDTGTYAGISRATYTQWKGNVKDAGAGGVTFALLRELRRLIYIASGEKPDLFVCDPIQHEKIGALFGAERRYVQDVRTQGGVIKLEGGYQVLEFDGISIVEDSEHPAQKISCLNTRHVYLSQLADAPQIAALGMGNVQLAGTPEEQLGAGKMKLTARINPLARTGDAYKFQLILYPQVVVRKPQTCGYLTNLAA